MLKKARLLTRPTLARRDAPCPKQGRNSAVDPRFTFHGFWERSENAAGELFSILLVVRWFEVARWAVLPGDRRLFGLFDETT